MPIAEDKSFRYEPVSKINPSILETFPYYMKDVKPVIENFSTSCEIIEDKNADYNKEVPQKIVIKTEEFSAVCPFSGLPDIGTLTVEYIPYKLCVELKSFKYYLLSFRNVGIYQEHATRKIFYDLEKLLKPRYLKVVLKYNIRGGIETTCEMEKNYNRGERNE